MNSMPKSIAAAASSRPRWRPPGSSPPSWILLNDDAYVGSRPNNTTAVGEGRDHLTIEASFWPAQPPLPTDLFVCCRGATYPHPSKIVTTDEDLLLFRVPVAVGPPPDFMKLENCDYIIYRAGEVPSLTLIPNPKPNIFDGEVGLLRRAGDLFTVAALVGKPVENEYMLQRFDSEVGKWTLKTVCLETPRKPFPVKIPMNALRLNHHITTTVITLGGKAGTMGWVDLWSGILLYDLFPLDSERAVLRHMQLPLPMHAITSKRRLMELGCPADCRGIASVVKDGKPCLKLVDLQILEDHLPYDDIETDMPCYVVEDWAITVWSNNKMGCSASYCYKDWQEDFTVWASQITISETVHSELLTSGLLQRNPSHDGEETVKLALQNLVVSEPKPSLNGEEDVVYLMARPKPFLPTAWSLAIDMYNKTLLGVDEFCTNKPLGHPGVTTSTISSYMNPPTSPVARET